MIALLLTHLVVGVGIIAFGRRLGTRAAVIAVLPAVATLAWLLARRQSLFGGGIVTEKMSWMPALGLDLELRIDGFSAMLVLLVAGIGVAVHVYARTYLDGGGPRTGRLIGLLVLFGGAMLGVVTADHLLVLYGFWELTTITSFLLIGNDHEKPEARAASVQALLVTGAGGLSMLGGFLLLGSSAGTWRLGELLAAPPSGTVATVGVVLVLLGAFTKSAQVPFHSWLPGAMVAPTPVSAYLHSATMVKAGVYLIARFAPAFAPVLGWWRPVVVSIGLATMLAGGLRALRQQDLKLLLAHGTVSQLGFLVAVFGIGSPRAAIAGTALLFAHAVFKAANFLTVGAVDIRFGTRDRRQLPRLDRTWLPTAITAVVGAASMAGIPLTFGFVAKELTFDAMFAPAGPWWFLAAAVLIVGAAFTAGYSLRFASGLLGRDAIDPVDRSPAANRAGVGLTAPMIVLTAVTLVFGIIPAFGDQLFTAAARGLTALDRVELAIWHGLGAPLLASIAVLTVGVALHAGRRTLTPSLERAGHRVPDANSGYRGALQGLNVLADRTTAITQPGALPIYAGVVLTVAAVLPLTFFTLHGTWPGWPELVGTPAHLPIVAALLGSALAAVLVRRRFSAALFLGVSGYAMAALFVVQGSPDLALTQVSIETLSTVLFVLVLRRLPDQFTWAPKPDGDSVRARLRHRFTPEDRANSPMTTGVRARRIAAAVSVFSLVFVLAIVTSSEQPDTPATDEMIERSLPDGHGRNIVNVTLVDFRGYDTLGEITVLACAALGTIALARAGRRPARAGDTQRTAIRPSRDRGFVAPVADDTAEVAPPLLTPLSRLVIIDVTVRVVFSAVMIGSLYLLFAGHNRPGGGFAGGILAGAAVSLRYLAGGIESVRSLIRFRPWTILGTGIGLAGLTALTPILFGHPVLTSGRLETDLPLLGTVEVGSVLVFDLGVYLAVLSLAMMLFESFGDDPFIDREDLVEAPTDEVEAVRP